MPAVSFADSHKFPWYITMRRLLPRNSKTLCSTARPTPHACLPVPTHNCCPAALSSHSASTTSGTGLFHTARCEKIVQKTRASCVRVFWGVGIIPAAAGTSSLSDTNQPECREFALLFLALCVCMWNRWRCDKVRLCRFFTRKRSCAASARRNAMEVYMHRGDIL